MKRRMASAPLRFSPSPMQLAALDACAGVAAYTLATLLRFADEGSVPATYAERLLPWLLVGAAVHVGAGELMSRLRRPGSVLARRPVAPFLIATALELASVLFVNDVLLRDALVWRLPHSVAIVAPLLAGAASSALRLAAARSIDLEELLPRRGVPLDASACGAVLANKRVLITGGAGSIGAEMARQVLALGPESVLAVDMNETGLYELQGELASDRLHTTIADVADARRMRDLFLQVHPDIVFHAAAYKHVPLMEENPDQGFLTNVVGTLSVCEAAVASGAERVVVISTDKAVNPSSFMGLTKRVAELIVAAMTAMTAIAAMPEAAPSRPVFSAVRFGNVLGSRGSVVPILMRQIESGGPLTITHPDVQRFFMTLSEAARLVLLACAYGGPGGIYVLDMGEEVRIEQLAERLVRLKGLRPGRDLAIQYVGLRPGEKLREELYAADERLVATDHEMVWRVEPSYSVDAEAVLSAVRALDQQRRAGELQASDYASRLWAIVETAVKPSDAVATR